jgi:UDP-glucose 4-epimerase
MNILITGSSGFIGSHLSAGLAKKYTLFLPGHRELDLLDEKKADSYFKNHAIDVVIHGAVIGGNGPHMQVPGMFYDNVRIFFNLVRNRKYFKRFINIGSGAVYDKRFPIRSVKESDFGKRMPDDEYGLYKYICSEYIETTKTMVDLRVFGIFGEGEDYRHRFISNALCRYMFGLPITMNRNVYFDYLDVKDFISIVDYFITHKPKYTAYNIGSGERISLLTIARTIAKLGKEPHIIQIKQKGYGKEYTCNAGRLRHEIPRLTFLPFTQSLLRLSSWYAKKKNAIRKEDL